MSPHHVLFDVDGTLVDSNDLHAEAWREAFLKFGRDVPLEDVRRQIGKGGDQLVPVFFSDEEVRRFGEELSAYRGELYRRDFLPRVRAFPGVRELFLRLRADQKRIALASSAKEDEITAMKKLARIDDLIEAATSADDAERSKPHPDVFRAALAELGDPDPGDCVVIGDTPYDAEAARKAGLATIGVLSGGFGQAVLERAGCVRIHRDVAEILARYDEVFPRA